MADAAHSTTVSRRQALAISVGVPAAIAAFAYGVPVKATTLADEFETALAAERAVNTEWNELGPDYNCSPEWEAAYNRVSAQTSRVVDKIIADPSRNLESLRLKSQAYLWCYANDAEDALACLLEKSNTTDVKVLHAILRDLLAI